MKRYRMDRQSRYTCLTLLERCSLAFSSCIPRVCATLRLSILYSERRMMAANLAMAIRSRYLRENHLPAAQLYTHPTVRACLLRSRQLPDPDNGIAHSRHPRGDGQRPCRVPQLLLYLQRDGFQDQQVHGELLCQLPRYPILRTVV